MRRALRCTALLLFAAPLAACDKPDSIVVVHVDVDPGVTAMMQLRAQTSNGGDGTIRMFPTTPTTQAIVFPTSFSLSVPRDRTGALDIALDGLGDGGPVVAHGDSTVDLHVGDNVTMMITLHAGPSTCGNNQVDADEECDDGDRLSAGDCDYLCHSRAGGPGVGGRGGTGATGTAGTGGAAGTGGSAGMGGTGGRPCMIELLTSGGFDGNNFRWTQVTNSRSLIYDQSAVPSFVPAPNTPTRLAWLGYDVVTRTPDPALRQSITIPADALQVNISGYFQIQTDESGCQCDKAFVEVDVGGNVTKLIEWNNENANTSWAFFSTFVNGTAVAGQTITLQLRAEMDDGVNTSFYFDSLSVTADSCP